MHDHKKEMEKLHCGLHLGIKIAELVLKAAAVCAAFCAVKEIHKVHKGLEKRHLWHSK